VRYWKVTTKIAPISPTMIQRAAPILTFPKVAGSTLGAFELNTQVVPPSVVDP
jgi:hypothetical protein